MSADNGHLPEGAVMATLDMLRAANTKTVPLPKVSERTGVPTFVRIKPIRRPRYRAMLPVRPPEADAWPTEDYQKHHNLWLNSLSPEDRLAREKAEDDVSFKILEACLVDPPYSDEIGEWLFDDADELAVTILEFSNILLKKAPSAEVPAPETVS
jgi:hypothetical protein